MTCTCLLAGAFIIRVEYKSQNIDLQENKMLTSSNKRLLNSHVFVFTLARNVRFLYFNFLLKIQFESSELPEFSQVHPRDRVNASRGNFMCFETYFKRRFYVFTFRLVRRQLPHKLVTNLNFSRLEKGTPNYYLS